LQVQVGGAYHVDILGNKISGGLLAGESAVNTYQVKTLIGNSEIQSIAGNTSVKGLLVLLN
jgi:hypothetical protein